MLAVAATVGEAAARWYAVGIQKRADAAERENGADSASRAADRLANQVRERQDRRLIDKGLTDWLTRASMGETVRLWRTATIYAASGNPRAARVAALAHQRLRQMHQPLMDAYDRHRARGMGQAEAMRAAAYEIWEAEARANPASNARAHGNKPQRDPLVPGADGRALTAGGAALDELDAAVRAEVATLAAHISPETLDKLQREWRDAGMTPAADAAGLLAQFAQDAARSGVIPRVAADGLVNAITAQAAAEQRAAELDSGQPDDPATAGINEHHDGQDRAAVHTDRANADLVAAADQQRLMGQAFPPLTHIGRMPSHVLTKRPATVTTTQRKPRTR